MLGLLSKKEAFLIFLDFRLFGARIIVYMWSLGKRGFSDSSFGILNVLKTKVWK